MALTGNPVDGSLDCPLQIYSFKMGLKSNVHSLIKEIYKMDSVPRLKFTKWANETIRLLTTTCGRSRDTVPAAVVAGFGLFKSHKTIQNKEQQ